jgi:FKBP-type peptidyl-prolyl cis-trans isomerase SlpA
MKKNLHDLPLARVKEDSIIEISFTLSLLDGTLVDKTEEAELLKLTIGDGQFIKNLEDLFIGLEEGTKAKFNLASEQAYGQPDMTNIQTMKEAEFPKNMELVKGNIVEFNLPTGNQVLGTIYDLVSDQVLVDFNHPLAGKSIIFEFKIEKIFT